MAGEIVGKAVRHDFILLDKIDRRCLARSAVKRIYQQRIMRTAKHNGINIGRLGEELVIIFFYEIICAGVGNFAGFHEGGEHRAGLLIDADFRVKFLNFKDVRLRIDGALRAEYAHVVGIGESVDYLGCGADDAEDAIVGIEGWKVTLLNGAESLGGGGVAGKDYERTPQIKKTAHRLQRVGVHRLKTS